MARAAPKASAADCSMFLRSMGTVDDIPLAWSAFMLRAQVLLRATLLEAEDIVSWGDGTTNPWATSLSDRAVATAIVSFMVLQVVVCRLCRVYPGGASQLKLRSGVLHESLLKTNKIFPSL